MANKKKNKSVAKKPTPKAKASKPKKLIAKPTKAKAKPTKAKAKPTKAKAKPTKVVAKPVAPPKAKPTTRPAPTQGKGKRATVDVAAAAAELISLERELLAGRNDQSLIDRWVVLIKQVLGSGMGPHARRSVRLPAGVPVRLGIRQGEFLCHLTDLSQLGLTVAGPVLAHIAVGEPVELRSIEQSGQQRGVGVRCEVVRIDSGQNPAVAGLRLAADNDSASSQRFFDAIYYPFYLAYLERAAQGAQA